MPRFLVRLRRGEEVRYLEWSTIPDAPVTRGMTRAQLEAYVQIEYGNEGLRHLGDRFRRIEKWGHSLLDAEYPVEELIDVNRAGPKERQLGMSELWDHYCDEPPHG